MRSRSAASARRTRANPLATGSRLRIPGLSGSIGRSAADSGTVVVVRADVTQVGVREMEGTEVEQRRDDESLFRVVRIHAFRDAGREFAGAGTRQVGVSVENAHR